jgi:hypothetical protein
VYAVGRRKTEGVNEDMEKVKLTMGQAQDIESLKHNYKMTEESILEMCFRDRSFFKYKAENIAHIPLDTLIRALYIGYEAEETPEDKVREYFLHQNEPAQNVIIHTLNLIGKSVEGVNT